MKIIKTFEEWSPKFNRTLQGAAALATSTNKPHQKKQSIEDYANRSISKEEFMFKVLNDRDELGPNVLSIAHDPKFILKPIEQFTLVNRTSGLMLLSIPVLLKYHKKEDGTILPTEEKHQPHMLTFTEDGSMYMNIRMGDWDGKGHKIKFVDRASIENLMAMAIQAITSSPEPGTPVESQDDGTGWGPGPVEKGMTKEKQDILNLIQKIVLNKDMRSFTI